MKHIFLFIGLGLLGGLLSVSYGQNLPFGQVPNCDDFEPESFVHTVDRNTFPDNWDWREQFRANWEVYLGSGKDTILSPFDITSHLNHPNVNHLSGGVLPFDYEPSDGWELVYRFFGNDTTVTPFPAFALYNRFNAILRVFVWGEFDSELLSDAAVIVRFSDGQEKGSAALSLIETPTHALEGFDVNLTSLTPNEWVNGEDYGTWLMADIPMTYDPCTCEQSFNRIGEMSDNISEIEISGNLIETFQVTTNDPLNSTPIPVTSMDHNNLSWSDASKLVNNAGKFFTSVGGLLTEVNEAKKNNAASSNSATVQTDTAAAKGKDAEAESIKEFRIPAWMKIIPKVGPVLTAVDALITGGKKETTANTSQAGVVTRVQFNGTLVLDGPILLQSFYTPGSEHENLSTPTESKRPVYDHVMGIFTLIDQPKMEYVTYQPVSVYPSSYQCVIINGNEKNFVLPPIRQYHLDGPISYAVNPSSELELIDLSIQIQYQLGSNLAGFIVDTAHQVGANMELPYPSPQGPNSLHQLGLYGPVAIGNAVLGGRYGTMNYEDRMRSYGIEITSWPRSNPSQSSSNGVNDIGKITYSTGFFPAQCGSQQSVFLAVPESNTPFFSSFQYEPTFTLKVRAILRRRDAEADDDTEDVIFMATYPIKTEAVAGGGSYSIPIYSEGFPGPNLCQTHFTRKYLRDYVVRPSLASSQGNSAFFPMGNNGLPFDLTLENTSVSTSQYALNSITIANTNFFSPDTTYTPPYPGAWPITVPGPEITIQAGREIVLGPGSNQAIGSPNVNLELGLPAIHFDGCDTNPLPAPASVAEIAALCADSTRYSPLIRARQAAPNPIKPVPTIPLTAQPNPFTDELTFRYELKTEAQVQIVMVDMMGRPVRQILPGSHRKSGPQEMTIDLSDLASGLYTVMLQVGNARQTVKVVKR